MADIEKDLRNVIVFAMADGDFNDEERTFVNGLRRRAGIDDAAYEALLAEAQSGDNKLSLSRDAEEARRIVQLLVQAATADNVVSDRHQELLGKIARHIDLDEAAVTQMIADALAADAVEDIVIEKDLEDIYAHFNAWDDAARQGKLDHLAAYGAQAVLPMLRLLESYRVPDGAANALTLKQMAARKLGQLGDGRAVYYLAQQVNIGDLDDEITDAPLRYASAEALGKITGENFSGDRAGVVAAREWWSGSPQRDPYDRLAL